jgi:uncharacterized cupredoxin-like copper-binding protein
LRSISGCRLIRLATVAILAACGPNSLGSEKKMTIGEAISNSRRERKASYSRLKTATLLALPMVAVALSSGVAATAPKVIAVELLDATDDPSMAGMQLTVNQNSVPAGPITFAVTNRSKSIVHELLVVKVPDANTNLPYDEKDSKVVENKLNKLVDSDDIKPGIKKSFTVTLKPGDYLLICNEAGHYRAGMRAALTATK